MRVPVRDPTGRKVDAITTEQPLGSRIERHGRGELLSHSALLLELPDQCASGHRGRAEIRLVAVDVVDSDVAAVGFDSFRVVVERQDQ
jgi:hypothetical protein